MFRKDFSMRRLIALSAMAIVAGHCHAALAQDQAAAPTTMMQARDIATDFIAQDLSHEEIGVLNLVAHAAAASHLCEEVNLDNDAVSKAIDTVTGETMKDSSDEEKAVHRDRALIGYGVLVGLMIAEGAEDETGFCAGAVEMAKDPETEKFIKTN